MTNLEITLTIIAAISILINVGLAIYARAAIVRLLSVAEELYDLKEMTDSLSNHLQSVYELEMFYGDQTLQALMDHSRSYAEHLNTFEYVYGLIEEDDNNNSENNTDTKEEETAQAS